MTRPWRLTRRQRVEMECAIDALRRDVRTAVVTTRTAYETACLLAPRDTMGALYLAAVGHEGYAMPLRTWRTLAARVAIALRAALRADEDARCEEAGGGCSRAAGYMEGVEDGIDAMREWLPLRHEWRAADGEDRDVPRVPLALWEAR